VFKSDVHSFSKLKEENTSLLAGLGVELAGLHVEADAHCGVLVRG
jgi:hypothetical protein